MSKLNIYACSGVGAVSSVQRVVQDIENSGWMRNETLRKYLGTSKDGGCAEYFLYIFIPEEDLAKYNATIIKKRKQQLKTYAYVRELFVGHQYGSEVEMLDVIRKGIEKTFGDSVENVLAGIRGGNGVGLPLTASAIAAIVTAVLSAVVTIVTAIIKYCQSVKIAKYTAPSFEEIEASAPAPTDMAGGTRKNGLLWGAIAGVALFLIGTFKK
jgi:hypothetical protein